MLVSFIIIAYNAEKFLDKSLESLMEQEKFLRNLKKKMKKIFIK